MHPDTWFLPEALPTPFSPDLLTARVTTWQTFASALAAAKAATATSSSTHARLDMLLQNIESQFYNDGKDWTKIMFDLMSKKMDAMMVIVPLQAVNVLATMDQDNDPTAAQITDIRTKWRNAKAKYLHEHEGVYTQMKEVADQISETFMGRTCRWLSVDGQGPCRSLPPQQRKS